MDCEFTLLKNNIQISSALQVNAIDLLNETHMGGISDYIPGQDIKSNNESYDSERFKVAVTSKKGKLVDQHFGQTTDFMIFEVNGQDYKFLETRSTKKYCDKSDDSNDECHGKINAIEAISDCDFVLSMKIGLEAQKKLHGLGIDCIEYYYTIEKGLKYLQTLREQKTSKK